MPLATFCDELKVYNCEEPYKFSSSIKILEKPNLYGNISWSGDAALVTVTPASDPVQIFRYGNGQLLSYRTVNVTDVKSATFLNWANKDLVLGLENGEIRIWNIHQKIVSCVIDAGPKQPVNFLTCNLDDTCVASGSLTSNRIGLHSLRTNKYLRCLELPRGDLTSCLRFSQCKKGYLAASSTASTVCVWDVIKSQVIFKPNNVHQGACSGLEFSPVNFAVLATVGLSQRLKMFDLRQSSKILDVPLNEPLHCVDVFQEGDKVAVGSTSGSVIIFDLRANKVTTSIKAHNDVVTAISINKLERLRKQHDGDVTSSEIAASINRTLDLSVMDLFSPIARDNSNGQGDSVIHSSVDITQEFIISATPAQAHSDSFLSRMLSPRPAPMLMSSPIVDPVPASQPEKMPVISNQPPTVPDDPPVQQNVSEDTLRMVRPNGHMHTAQVLPNSMGQGNANLRLLQDQRQSLGAAIGGLPQSRLETQRRDICLDNIMRELHNIREEQEVSSRLLTDQITLLEDTLMTRININHDAITDMLLNIIKRDIEKGSFELRYELVTQRNSHTDCFNVLIERTENLAMLLADLTQQVAALQNMLFNFRPH